MKSRYPVTHLLNPKFRYVHSSKTDLVQTFARVRAEMAARDTTAVPIRATKKGGKG